MEPKKNSATTESISGDADLFDLDPPVGQRVGDTQTTSLRPRRRSQSILRSESNPPAPSPCATRDVPGEDCAFQKFIVWAAVKRNKSVRMVPSDRLRCPLLLCGERFDDHETMLRHLTKCQHLKTGEYLCYDCMKVERLNDGKCRCCLGHPTKRRRIMNMARNFFSNIGNRSRREVPSTDFQDDVTLPPPSYDSLVVDLEELSEQQQRQQQEQQLQPQPQLQLQPQIELNGREIHELDSRQMLPTAQLDSVNYDTRFVDIPVTSDRRDATLGVVAHPQTNLLSRQAASVTQDVDKDDAMPPPSLLPSNSGGRRPSLALDTHVDHYRSVPRSKHLSPSSSLRSTGSSQNISPVTAWSASSGGSGAWTMCSGIDTEMTSPITPLSPIGPPPISRLEDAFTSTKEATKYSDDDCNYMVDDMPELPGDDLIAMPRGLTDPFFFSFDPKDNYSWMQSVNTELSLPTSVNMMFTDTESKPAGISSAFVEPPNRGLDTRTLVESTWDTLLEHVLISMSKLTHIEGNPLIEQLRTQSPRAIALTGLSSLRRVLGGNDLTDPLECICLVHLIYAFMLVIHPETDLATRGNSLYQQALAYRGFLNLAHLKDYTQIVTTLWQPPSDDQTQTQGGGISLGGSSSSKGKEPQYFTGPRINLETDPLIAVGQNFLDDLEYSVISSDSEKPIEVHTSDLWSTHFNEYLPGSLHNSPFTITVDYIIQVLSSKFHDSETLSSKLREIGQRVRVGYITTVRKFELAILQAGKNSLGSSDLFNEFIPQVRRLCDPIYSEQGFHPRTTYQIQGVSLVETLVQTIASESQHTNEQVLYLPEDEFLTNLHKTFGDPSIGEDFLVPLPPGAPQQNQTQLATTQSFSPNIETMTLLDHNRSTQQPSNAERSFTPVSHIGTPTESFTASPKVSMPFTVPTPPKASTPGRAGASPKPPSSSTMQKTEANDSCEICGYRPKGDPQWFKGSMAKHKKMQHSTGPPIIYKCPYPGCNSQYKNRQDNLRQHQIEKNHFVGDEASRRPHKRAKTSPS
ncbi:hypothetical protein F4804DRAFT_112267 [Jackrogersella minutella]|nr:hypothetical protein F4804DRAFT_112267 [Jackrogersella minutella]